MKLNNRFILIFLISLFLIFLFGFYRNHSLSFHFVDEEDNIVLGNYLLKGEKLYKDLFSHHQPLAYIFSAGVQKITNPKNIFLLIERHRETIMFWSIVWSILLVARFGWPLFLFAIIYEPIKFFLLGHLFLSESFVVYPLAYIISFIFLRPKPLVLEYFFLGLCFSLTIFLLSPLWPAVIFLLIICLFQIQREVKSITWFLTGGLLIFAIIFPFISLADYLYNAFYINFRYYIPLTGQEFSLTTFFKAFFSPFISLTIWNGRSATLQIIQFLSVIFLFNLILFLKAKKNKNIILMFLLLGFINLRFIQPGQQEYNGFHILPWFASLIIICTITSFWVMKNMLKIWPKFILGAIFFFILSFELLESRQTLFVLKDANKDFFINYSRQEDFGRAIKIMKKDGEKLFVSPDEWLIYWQADIDHFSKMVNYYAWMSEVSEIKKPLMQKFASNPPAYFYCDNCEQGYFGLEKYFDKYQRIKKDGNKSNLMVLKDKLQNLDQKQKDQLKYFRFTTQ